MAKRERALIVKVVSDEVAVVAPFLMSSGKWAAEYPDAWKFDALGQALAIARLVQEELPEGCRPVVVENYGLATEITYEIG